jgi:hypothetical protein
MSDALARAAKEWRDERERNEAPHRAHPKPNGGDAPWNGNGADDENENYEDTLARVVPEDAIAASEPLPKLVPIRFVKGQPVPELEWTVRGWVPKQEVTLVQGDGGLGKSTIVQQLQKSCATERPWLGQLVEPCASVGFYTEDKQWHLEIRQAAINRAYGVDHDLTTAMALFPRRGEDNELVVFDRGGKPTLTPFYLQVCEAAQDYHAGLVVLDVAVDLYGGDEIKRRQVRAFIRTLNNLADKIAGSIVMTGHVSQAGLQSDGGHSASTDWSNGVRSRLYLGEAKGDNGAPVDANARVLTRKKANFAGVGDTIELHWRDGVFTPDAPAFPSPFRRAVDDVFLALLDAVTREGQKVSAKPRAGNNAPGFFMKRTPSEREGYQRGDFEHAMQALLKSGKIKIVPYGPPSHGCEKLIRADDGEGLS